MAIKIGIAGYGNLGRGVELAVQQNDDIELAAVYTRRDPESVQLATEGIPVRPMADLEAGTEELDVVIICGGSPTDLPQQTPTLAAHYNVVDSFDTHANIPDHFATVDAAAQKAGTVGLISCGWDPGLFSLNRLFGNCFVPQGSDYTFWGKGISQGHSDAIRRIEGVADAKQYTLPIESALEAVRTGSNPELTTRQKHTRECWVVLEEGADADAVRRERDAEARGAAGLERGFAQGRDLVAAAQLLAGGEIARLAGRDGRRAGRQFELDPRAVILKHFATQLAEGTEYEREFKLLESIERISPQILRDVKGTKKDVCANVDMYSGFVYAMLGIPEDMFTPLFAC